ncbi:MAG: VIT1/CCC1 transporter family protein [Promethearchaeota archaeon]
MGKLKTYNEITGYAKIARRYFVNNFYDGMLTILGILLGFFVILLNEPGTPIQSNYVILTGLGTSISMLISGISGSYLSERAEQRKGKKELEQAMGIQLEKEKEAIVIDEKEIQKAMVVPPKNLSDKAKRKAFIKRKIRKEKLKTLHEKAERFTGVVVSLVNGISPFLGGVVAIIPFFFFAEAGITVFITSFVIIFVCIIFLGAFLGIISKESIPKNIIQMLVAFAATILITILFLGG